MIATINKSWGWKGFNAVEVIATNEFGNVILKTDANDYWRICPEEINCEKIAETESDLEKLLADPEYKADWDMPELLKIAESELGKLEEEEKYCLKMPAVIGGLYEKNNLGKVSFSELISFSGEIGFQLKGP